MIFVTPGGEEEHRDAHPELKGATEEIDAWMRGKGYGHARITEVVRDDDGSQRIYLPIARRVRAKQSMGEALTEGEEAIATATEGMDEDALAQWARKKFSWHRVKCAEDIGLRDLSTAQRATVKQYVAKKYQHPLWEVRTEEHGTGPHIHIGRRDFSYRNTFPK